MTRKTCTCTICLPSTTLVKIHIIEPMSSTPAISPDLFSRSAIRDALKRFHNAGTLGEHALAQLNWVDGRAQTSETPLERGTALRELLRAGIESLRPDESEPRWGEKRWRPYLILSEQYLHSRKPDYLADALGLVRGTFHQEQARALELLGSWLGERQLMRERDQARQSAQSKRVDGAVLISDPSLKPFLAPPRPPHSIVGRARLINEIKQQLAYGHALALQGLPGAGKTALAIELANDDAVRQRFRDGVLWIGAGRNDPDIQALMGVWLSALGIEPANIHSIEDAARAIHAAIGTRHMLLVIDDAWDSEVALAFKLGGPNCAHLVTTRLPAVAIDFAGNRILKVDELDDRASAQLLQQFVPALEDAALEDAALEDGNLQSLMRASGGLPLALTLMGRYLRKANFAGQPSRLARAVSELSNRESRLNLAQPEALLAQRPGWQASMPLSLFNVIGHSEALLTSDARQALHALALLEPKPNAFSEAAALAIAGMPADTSIHAIDLLVDAGLLEGAGAAADADANQSRYTLHQTVCDYARLGLSDEAARDIAQRVTSYYAGFVEQRRTHYAVLQQEQTNLLRALDLAHTYGLQRDFIRLAVGFYNFLGTRSLYALAEQQHLRALAASHAHGALLLPQILLNLGWIARRLGQLPIASQRFENGLAEAESTGDYESQSALLLGLATIENDLGHHHQAREYGERGLAIADKLSNRELITMLLIELALISSHMNHVEAEGFLLESVRMARETGDQRLMSLAFAGLGITAFWKGFCDDGERYLREGTLLSKQIGYTEMHGLMLALQAWVDANRGNYSRALDLATQSLEITRDVEFVEAVFAAHLAIGTAAYHRGDHALAETHLQEGLRLSRQVDQHESIGWLLGMLARLELQRNDLERAERYALEGLEIAQSAQHSETISPLLAVLGQLAAREGQHDEARGKFDEALQLARTTHFPWLVCYTQNARGEWLLFLEELDAAQIAFEEAKAIAEQLGAQEMLATALQGLGRVAQVQGEDGQALIAGSQMLFREIGHHLAQ